jgi:lauroyl/myristoyl acyltransferase
MGAPMAIPPGMTRDEWIPQAAQRIADQIASHVRERPECWYHFYRYWDAQRDDYQGLH